MPEDKSNTTPEDQPDPPPRPVLFPGNQIDSIRDRLEDIFTQTHLALQVCITVHKAMLHQNVEQDGDFAAVLQRCGSYKLDEQLEQLAAIVEELGGETEYSDRLPLELEALLNGEDDNDE